MTDSRSNPANPAWLDQETARRYKQFTEKTTMYQDLSHFLVELAILKPGMRLLDLGCGTGITTQAALAQLDKAGYRADHIYALDVSAAMLNIARETLPDDQITYLHADAAHFAGQIDAPIDLILCNSLFWQFRDKSAVLAELHRVLAPDGLFIFNVPEPYLIFKWIPRSEKVAILFKQLAAERYGVGTQDLRTLEVFLNNHRFTLLKTRLFERLRSAEESYHFMQLPVSTAWMEPPLAYERRMALLDEAWQMASSDTRAKRRWMYFVTRPQ